MGQPIEPRVSRPARPAELLALGAFVVYVGLWAEPPARTVVPITGVLLAGVGLVGAVLAGVRRAQAFQRALSCAVAVALFGLAGLFLVVQSGIEWGIVVVLVGAYMALGLYFVERALRRTH